MSSLPELHFSVFCYLWSTSSEAQVGCPPYFRCLNHPSTQLPPPPKTTFPSQLLFINDAFEKGDYPPTKESPAIGSSPECSSAVHSKRIESSGFSKGPKTKYFFSFPIVFLQHGCVSYVLATTILACFIFCFRLGEILQCRNRIAVFWVPRRTSNSTCSINIC